MALISPPPSYLPHLTHIVLPALVGFLHLKALMIIALLISSTVSPHRPAPYLLYLPPLYPLCYRSHLKPSLLYLILSPTPQTRSRLLIS